MNLFFQAFQKGFARRRQELVFLPGYETREGHSRFEGDEGQVWCLELEESVNAESTGNARTDELGGIGDEVEFSDDLQVLCCHFSLRPLTDVEGCRCGTRRDEQGNLAQGIGRDGWQLSPGRITAGDDADPVAFGQVQGFIFISIERLDEEGEVEQAVGEFLFDGVGIARK